MKVSAPLPSSQTPVHSQKLRTAAIELEAAFLGEMLKSAGLGKARQSFGGGAGEDQFASFLVQHQARALAKSGGVGLSEIIFQSMMEKTNAENP
ncbi:rod-binding protein [Ruegeria sp. Ofav3-42]|uniref:rod-binding protein n=1 Tax=Ruegeria sp. Ofav3-42 TaxID=2917759 RepID=UPI001EF3F6A9|nr:rod-binding protein [Ruegeria sp. Ofav3-42]MCG7520616.1 rod-binding protein [Ruegeria sp. Ofav3-42]